MRNEVVRNECGIGDISNKFIKDRRKYWHNYEERAVGNRLIKIAEGLKLIGGRPLKIWADSWKSFLIESLRSDA